MADTTFTSPEHAAQALAAGTVKAGPASSQQSVCLALGGSGWFKLTWSAVAIGKYDWIGLYTDPSKNDTDYVGGNNWYWAVNGSYYVTNTAATGNYEARYLVYDDKTSKYVSVARSGPFPGQVCSS